MQIEEIMNKKTQDEDYYEMVQKTQKQMEKHFTDCEELIYRERKQNEALLFCYPDQHEFERMHEDCLLQERSLYSVMDEGQDLLDKEKRHIDIEREQLYEEELNILRKEEEDGQDGGRGSRNSDRKY